jgi:N-acetylglucosamine-6-phosphate deacetylase
VGGASITGGFIDTHTHGAGGVGTEDNSAEALVEMSRVLVKYGVTAFNPTMYPTPKAVMPENVAKNAGALGKESGAKIMGLHLEGPFISPEMTGVQKPETISPVDIPLMEALWQAAAGRIVNMTVAPEIKNMRELALYCVKKGIVLQAGHTNARYENMIEGMQTGILHSTHLFNAMSKLDHHNPNAVGAVLAHPEMSCEVIADGFHIHPDLFKLLLRDKPIEKIVLVTDSLKPTEWTPPPDVPMMANGEEVAYRDGLFRRRSDDVTAGSALTMIRGVKNLVSFGFSLEDAVRTANYNPAAIMRYTNKGAIIPGKDGDIVVFDKNFNVLLTLVGGEIKYER